MRGVLARAKGAQEQAGHTEKKQRECGPFAPSPASQSFLFPPPPLGLSHLELARSKVADLVGVKREVAEAAHRHPEAATCIFVAVV